MMGTELLHKASNVEISYDPEAKILFCKWIGLQSEDLLKESGWLIHGFLKKRKCSKILNDNTLVLGHWYHSVDWTANEWFPAMIKAGLKHFAWICSRDIFAQLSAKRALPTQEVVKAFYSYDEGSEWLKSK